MQLSGRKNKSQMISLINSDLAKGKGKKFPTIKQTKKPK